MTANTDEDSALLPRIRAQVRSSEIAEDDAKVWQPRVKEVESRYADKWCSHCGYEKRVGGICTKCFRS